MSGTRLMYCSLIVSSLAIAGKSTPDDAPQMASDIVYQLQGQACFDIDNPTAAEKLVLHRMILKKALAIVAEA